MLHSKFGSESLPQKKKKSPFRSYLLVLFIILLFGGIYWIYNNYPRLIFRFKKDKYATIIKNINDLEVSLNDNSNSNDINTEPTEELLTGLIKDNPADSYLYYLYGRLFTIECVEPILKDPEKLTEIFFLDYIKRYRPPTTIDVKKWEKGISYTRKALLLGLQESEEAAAKTNLISLYLIGGTSYWISARDYLNITPDNTESFIHNLYKLIFTETAPEWTSISTKYGQEITTFWTALYNLKIKNYPVAFFHLKNLLLSESVYLRNNAYYIMGYIMGEQKDMNLKMYYHSLIDFEEFLKRNPWFLEEHNYTLRFMGQHTAAKTFLSQFEKLVLELKEEP